MVSGNVSVTRDCACNARRRARPDWGGAGIATVLDSRSSKGFLATEDRLRPNNFLPHHAIGLGLPCETAFSLAGCGHRSAGCSHSQARNADARNEKTKLNARETDGSDTPSCLARPGRCGERTAQRKASSRLSVALRGKGRVGQLRPPPKL